MGFFKNIAESFERSAKDGKQKLENQELLEKIESLRGLLSPEQSDVYDLQEKTISLRKTSSELEEQIEHQSETVRTLTESVESLKSELERLKTQIVNANDQISVQEYGMYIPNYEFANSDLYKDELARIRDEQKKCIKNDTACTGSTTWTVNGNASKGKAMVKDTKKLLLRAFNVECDDIVSHVKISNYEKSIERIERISEQISKLGSIMSISITKKYIKLKIEELNLALDFQQKKQEEKDRLKELKEQQREAAKVLKEIEEARKKLSKEHTQYENALSNILSQIEKNGENPDLIAKRDELQNQLCEIDKAMDDVDYRAANQRAGYVYIISNIGSFGEDVYKIGMTRRLNPQERIDELGDASVPFNFDVHALIFTEDAPKLESALHQAFEQKKLNKVNSRREFFRVSLDEIKSEVRKNFDKTVEWVDVAEAEQFRQSRL